jgi:anti-sigma B factor antagonist
MSSLEITITEAGDAVTVVLVGELDLSNWTRFESDLERIEADEPSTIVIDLRGVEFIDSTGLRALLAADERAQEGGHRLVIVRGNSMVQRVLRFTGVDRQLEIVADPAALEQCH